MRFGVQAIQGNVAWPDYLRLCQEIDRHSNYESLWTVDHLASQGDAAVPLLEGWATLAALATATSRLRLGCLVSAALFRHPAVLAKMATTIDRISGGRLEFGIGAGNDNAPDAAFGITASSLRERMDRFEETVEVIKLLWTSEGPVTHDGRYYRLDGAVFEPKNAQRPHPPILIGGGGEKTTLRIAARYADAINIHGSPDVARRKIEVLRRHCEDVGRDPSRIRITAQAMLRITPDEGLQQRTIEAIARYFGVDVEEAGQRVLVGSLDAVRERVAAYAEAGVHEMYVLETRLDLDTLMSFSREVVPLFGDDGGK